MLMMLSISIYSSMVHDFSYFSLLGVSSIILHLKFWFIILFELTLNMVLDSFLYDVVVFVKQTIHFPLNLYLCPKSIQHIHMVVFLVSIFSLSSYH